MHYYCRGAKTGDRGPPMQAFLFLWTAKIYWNLDFLLLRYGQVCRMKISIEEKYVKKKKKTYYVKCTGFDDILNRAKCRQISQYQNTYCYFYLFLITTLIIIGILSKGFFLTNKNVIKTVDFDIYFSKLRLRCFQFFF